jgi:hypothetical protein
MKQGINSQLNQQLFAKAVADVLVFYLSHPDRNRWINAIAAATVELEENQFWLWNETENTLEIFSHGSGELYVCLDDLCECTAFKRGNPCYHLAAFQILKSYFEVPYSDFSRLAIEAFERDFGYGLLIFLSLEQPEKQRILRQFGCRRHLIK